MTPTILGYLVIRRDLVIRRHPDLSGFAASDIQDAFLFLPRTVQGRDAIRLRLLQPIAAAFDWKKQRRLWKDLTASAKGLGETDRLS